MVIHNLWAVDQKGYYTCCWSWMKTEGRGLSMHENWPAGNNMVIDPYMSVGRIPLHDLTTTISVASKTFKNVHFQNMLLSSRRPHGWRIMNLFQKLKLSCTCSNSTSLPTPNPWNKARVKPPSAQTSPAHASYAQQFLSVNVSNRAGQCQISRPVMAHKQQQDSHA
jgi:hypothetical protein